MSPTISEIRAQFPSIKNDFAFLENAGGSQVPKCVIEAIHQFYLEDYVQIGGSYPHSQRASNVVENCRLFMNRIFNGEDLGYVAIGQSATALMNVLGNAFRGVLKPGDEVVISVANHESHIGPWERLQEIGVVVKWWGVDPMTGLSSLDDLREIVNPRTKLICFSQTCNIVGDNLDVKAVAEIGHSVGATVVADVVAAASHVVPDVASWGVDFCFFSCYKVYGPHMAALFGRKEKWAELTGPNHKQLPVKGANKFELGCLPYELLAGFLALGQYFSFLAGEQSTVTDVVSRNTIERAYGAMREQEHLINQAMLGWLNSRTDIRILGITNPAGDRHPTFSFVHDRIPSDVIVKAVSDQEFGIKGGNFYAFRACEAVGIDPDTGVVRVSAVHYNSLEEIQRVCASLENVLAGVTL
ncbi:MAG: aminotransferase class V-fold PLP-dependent enzyme [Fimbriimonadaceae bacterium]|nr:aminotransferase class V-fold PLP-dependent enzyme [Fimbriimonadaceae bacterium]